MQKFCNDDVTKGWKALESAGKLEKLRDGRGKGRSSKQR
jgi:hypothetical protein